MKKTKITAVFLTAAMGITMLASCGGQGQEQQESPSPSASAAASAEVMTEQDLYGKWVAIEMTTGNYVIQGEEMPDITMDIKEGGDVDLGDENGSQPANWELNGEDFKIIREESSLKGKLVGETIALETGSDRQVIFVREDTLGDEEE